MSWKAGLSRHLTALRFFACPESPSSRGVMSWYKKNYHELKHLNPTFPLLLRTGENCMPAVTTELDYTVNDLLRFCLQTGRFRDADGSISEARVEAAKAYLNTDWTTMRRERWARGGFDPERPFLEESYPDWRNDPAIASDLGTYLALRNAAEEQMEVVQSGPDKEYERAENALLMTQRVDLWCAGERETEAAVRHLLKLGRRFNDLEPEYPPFVSEYFPGADDLQDY